MKIVFLFLRRQKYFFLSSYCWIKRSFCGKRLASIYGRKATFPETEQTKKLSQSCVDGFFHSSGQSWQISIRFEVVVILLFFRPLRMPSVSLTWLWQIVKVSWTGYWRFISCLAKIWNPFYKFWMPLGKIFIVVTGQILQKHSSFQLLLLYSIRPMANLVSKICSIISYCAS